MKSTLTASLLLLLLLPLWAAGEQMPDIVEVSCTPVYYRTLIGSHLIPVGDVRLTNDFRVTGVVLKVLTPERLNGMVISFHFDMPEQWDWWYKPGTNYEGKLRRDLIGTLSFMCDPGWKSVRAPNEAVQRTGASGSDQQKDHSSTAAGSGR